MWGLLFDTIIGMYFDKFNLLPGQEGVQKLDENSYTRINWNTGSNEFLEKLLFQFIQRYSQWIICLISKHLCLIYK